MHILLTDILTCPRCGPGFGLIVLANRIDNRQVIAGRLGCANCRSSYPIVEGVGDLRATSGVSLGLSDAIGPLDERAIRTAALLGSAPPGAKTLLIEESASHAAEIASHFPEVHVVALSADVPIPAGAGDLLSPLATADQLPFRAEVFHGCAILGTPTEGLLSEALRVLAPGARIVVDARSEGTLEALRSAGAHILLDQDGVVVAATPGRR